MGMKFKKIKHSWNLLAGLHICQCFFSLQVPEGEIVSVGSAEDTRHYEVCRMCVEELALYLKPISGGKGESVERMKQVRCQERRLWGLHYCLGLRLNELRLEQRNVSCCSAGTCAWSVCGWWYLRQWEKQNKKTVKPKRPLLKQKKSTLLFYLFTVYTYIYTCLAILNKSSKQ